ncbi:hypothetical protein D3C84_548920 [compost metagenome]
MRLPTARGCKDRNHLRREISLHVTEHFYGVAATRNRVSNVETGSVIPGSKPSRRCCYVDWELAGMRGKLIAKQVKIATSDAFKNPMQGVR